MTVSINRKIQLQLDNEAVSKLRFATIQDAYVYEGRPFVDVIDSVGNLFTECNILGISGDAQNWSMTPIKVGMEVVILPTGYNSHAIVLGSPFKPATINGHLSDTELGMEHEDAQTAQTVDHLTMSMRDLIFHVGDTNLGKTNNTSYLHLTPLNGITMETNQMVRIQLPKDGILRISSDRQIVDEPLNGQQFINVITPFFQSLASITASQGDVLTNFNTALQTVSEGLDALAATSHGATVTNGQLAGYFATLATALAAAVAELAATNLQYGTLEYQYPTDELKPEMEATINRKVKLPK